MTWQQNQMWQQTWTERVCATKSNDHSCPRAPLRCCIDNTLRWRFSSLVLFPQVRVVHLLFINSGLLSVYFIFEVFLPSCWVHHSLRGGSQTFSFFSARRKMVDVLNISETAVTLSSLRFRIKWTNNRFDRRLVYWSKGWCIPKVRLRSHFILKVLCLDLLSKHCRQGARC